MTFDELKQNVIEPKIAENGNGEITGPVLQKVLEDIVDTTNAYITEKNPSKNNALTAEAYAKGTKSGVEVKEGEEGYEDNSKYYKDESKKLRDEIVANVIVPSDVPEQGGKKSFSTGGAYELKEDLSEKISKSIADISSVAAANVANITTDADEKNKVVRLKLKNRSGSSIGDDVIFGVGSGDSSGFYNVDVNIPLSEGTYYTKETAVAAVAVNPSVKDDVKMGMIITFWDNDGEKWRNYRYGSNDLTNFANPEYWGTFTSGGGAGSDYRVVYTPISNQSQTVGKNTTGIYVKFKVDVLNENNVSTGELINCQITVRQAGGSAQSFSRQVSPNTQVDIKLDSYISTGLNTITIKGIGSDTGTVGQYSFQVICVSLSLTSDFDLSTLKSKTMAVPYSISGDGNKTVEFFIDGVSVATDTVVASSASNTKTLPISGLSLTRHSLQLRASVTDVTYGTFYSNTLYFDFFVSGAVSALIGVGVTLGEGALVASGSTPAITGISQFGQYSLKIAAYNPSAEETNVTIYENSVSKGEISVANNTINEYVNVAKTAGTITLLLYSTDSNVYQMSMTVSASQTDLVDITDSLQLDLSALGRTNTGANKNQWKYTDAGGNVIETTFSNVPFNNTCGWVESKYLLLSNGGLANVGLQMLKGTDKSTGKTIEMEFKTANVMDENAVVASCLSTGTTPYGLKVTASSVVLTSQGGSTVETKYKAGENVRIGLVIHSVSDTERPMLIDLYVDGEHSGCTSYLPTDTFSVNGTLSMGSIDADLYVKTIKVYGKALNDADMLNNYTIDRDDAAELIDIYNENSILTNGKIDINKVNNEVPIVILTGDVDTLVALNNKTDSVRVTVEYRDVQNTDLNFTQENVKLKLQGTSSLTYPRKNFKFTLNSAWALRVNSLLAKAYCLKADFAESSGTHNTGVAKMWNGVLVNAGILTEAQVAYNNYCKANSVADADKKDVRTTVDGKPIVLFWKKTADSDIQFIGKYNLNTDKAAENTFGFKDIPGFDFTGCECWEFLDNTNPMCLFSSVDNWTTGWKNAFERRYPDDGTTEDTTELNKLCTWLVSVNPFIAANDADKLVRLNKFYSEVAEWFDVSALCAYYLYTEYFGAVDQRAKNCMLATYGNSTVNSTHKLWRFINYDNDTVNGLRNDGLLKYDYLIDENTIDTSINDYAYAGHNSGLWECLRRKMNAELIATAQKICSGDYPMSYANALKMFNETQMGAWCKRIYNLDGDYKYVQPYLSNGSPYLYAMQGSRSAHRRWWLYNRFAILNSKYSCGDFRGNYLSFLAAGAPKDVTFNVTVAVRMYLSWGYNNQVTESSGLLEAGSSYTFTNPVLNQIGNVASVYGGGYIRAIDLSNMAAYLARVDTNNIGDENNLISLILGKSGVTNTGLVASSFNISNATKLQVLDVQGMTALTGINLTNMTKLKTLLMENSGVSTISLAESAPIETLHFGNEMLGITLKDMTSLTTSGLSIGGYANMVSLIIKGCPGINTQSIVEQWLAGKGSADVDCTIDIDGINWTNFSSGNLSKIVAMGDANLKGSITMDGNSLTVAQLNSFREKFASQIAAGTLVLHYTNILTFSVTPSYFIGGVGVSHFTASLMSDGALSLVYDNALLLVKNRVDKLVNGCMTVEGDFYTTGTVDEPVVVPVHVTDGTISSDVVGVTIRIPKPIVSVSVSGDKYITELGGHTYSATTSPVAGETSDVPTYSWSIASVGDINTYSVSSDDTYYYIKNNGGTTFVTLLKAGKSTDASKTNVVFNDFLAAKNNDVSLTIQCNVIVGGTVRTSATWDVIAHAKFVPNAVQAYDSTEQNYNPAVMCVLVANATSFGITIGTKTFDDGSKGCYVTQDEIKKLTTITGEFNITTIIDTAGCCVESYEAGELIANKSYRFTEFNEFYYFSGLTTIKSSGNYTFMPLATYLTEITFPPIGNISIPFNSYLPSSIKKVVFPEGYTGYLTFLQTCPAVIENLYISSSVLCSLSNMPGNFSCKNTHYAGTFDEWSSWNVSTATNIIYGNLYCNNVLVTSVEATKLTACNVRGVQSITTIVGTVTSLSQYQFYQCTGLASITLADSITTIPQYCFYGCSALTSINLNKISEYMQNSMQLSGITTLENDVSVILHPNVFLSCSNLATLILHNSVVSTIDDAAFSSCAKLINFKPDTMSIWLSCSFGNAHSTGSKLYINNVEKTELSSTDFPSGATTINSYLFSNMTSLNVHSLPNTITSIGYGAFQNTISDISALPSSLVSCGAFAFSGTNATFSVIPDTVTSWGANIGMKMTSLSYPNTMTAPGGVTRNSTIAEVIFRKNDSDNYVITTLPSFSGSTAIRKISSHFSIDNVWCIPNTITYLQVLPETGSNAINLYAEGITSGGYIPLISRNLYSLIYFSSLANISGWGEMNNVVNLWYIGNNIVSLNIYTGSSTIYHLAINATTPPVISTSFVATKMLIPLGTKSTYLAATNWGAKATRLIEYDYATDPAGIITAKQYSEIDLTKIPITTPVIAVANGTATITCTDSTFTSSEAIKVWYSTDGTTYIEGVSGVTVSVSSGTTVYAYATHSLRAKSNTITYTVA